MIRKVFIAVVAAAAMAFAGCGPSATDIEWEETIKGYWKPVNEETGELSTSIPYYHFGYNANGASRYYKLNYTDTLVWEIRRKQMNIYYKEAVKGYYIGYNQYNSRSLMHIRNISENEVSLSQLYNNGAQSDYKLVRITPEEFYATYTDTVNNESGNSGSQSNIDNTF